MTTTTRVHIGKKKFEYSDDDGNNPNTFYCATCRQYFPLSTSTLLKRIKEVEDHICKDHQEQEQKQELK